MLWDLEFIRNAKGYIETVGVENGMLNCYDS